MISVLAAILGYWFMGFRGAILGILLGGLIEYLVRPQGAASIPNPLRGAASGNRVDFTRVLLMLSAAVMKADQKLMRSELDFIRQFFVQQFGVDQANYQMSVLKEVLQQPISLPDVCRPIRQGMQYSMRLQLMYYLFGIAKADGDVNQAEANVLSEIARYLQITDADFQSLRAMYFKDTDSAYKILEIEKSASDEEVKKAYRKMAMKFHPDKVRDLGEQHQKAANEKFLKVQEAYESIKKERGMV